MDGLKFLSKDRSYKMIDMGIRARTGLYNKDYGAVLCSLFQNVGPTILTFTEEKAKMF